MAKSLKIQKNWLFRQIILLVYTVVGEKKFKVSLRLFDLFQKIWFSFSYVKVSELIRLINISNKIDGVSKFDSSLSFGAKQNALQQIFFPLWLLKDLFTNSSNWISFDLLWFYVESIKECIYVCLSMQIQDNMFMSITAPLWMCFWAF